MFALANQNLSRTFWRLLSFFLFITVFLVEVLRIRSPAGPLNAVVLRLFRPFMRSHETKQFAGIAYYLFGVFVSSTLFPRTSGTIGILTLASLDPVAALAGSFFQKTLPSLRLSHGKSLAGMLCGCATATVVLFYVVTSSSASSLKSSDAWMLAVLVAWAGALTEFGIPSPQVVVGPRNFPVGIDDNAFIPIVCAFTSRYILRHTYHKLDLTPTLL